MTKFTKILWPFPVKANVLITKLAHRISYIFKLYVERDPYFGEHKRWVDNNGESTLRIDYPLQSDSVVFDLGGYKGDFSDAIISRYDCNIYLFEPVTRFFELCEKRFLHNSKVKCYNFGLSESDGEYFISDEEDGSSIAKTNSSQILEKVKIKKFSSTLSELGVKKIDLLKINIEGGEYSVLPHLIDKKLIQNIKYIQVQFHNFIPNAIRMRSQIRMNLSDTHKESWNYAFVWESWERK